MQFQTVVQAVIETLGAGAAALPVDDRFNVIGYQRQAVSAETALYPSVQIFYNSGGFPKGAGSFIGDSISHDMSMRIEMMVAGKARGDLAALENAVTPSQKMAALATFQEATNKIDLRIDQLWSDVWNILMDAVNETYGLPVGSLASRWVDSFGKNGVSDKGEIISITAGAVLTCRVKEKVIGIVGAPGDVFDVTLTNINNDVEQKTGVAGKLGEI